MAIHEMDLKENAFDSLNEALQKFEQAANGDFGAYKFCILHLSHFFELLLKYYVAQSHPLLIYRNPFAKKITDESHTIGIEEAIQFLLNEDKSIPAGFVDDLLWLKKLRNKIEHHKFSMKPEEVEDTIGRLMKAFKEFDQAYFGLELENHIDKDKYKIFYELATTYEERLKDALDKVEKAREEAYKGFRYKEYDLVDFRVYHCDECDNDTFIKDKESSTGYECAFCGATESDNVEVYCGVCGDEWPVWQMTYENWSDDDQKIFVCPRCNGDPEYRNDD